MILLSLPNQFERMRTYETSTPQGHMTGGVAALVMWPILLLAVIVGAVKMIHLRSYSSAVTAAIISVVPCCSPCFFLAIPFGIWALILLFNPQVKERFY